MTKSSLLPKIFLGFWNEKGDLQYDSRQDKYHHHCPEDNSRIFKRNEEDMWSSTSVFSRSQGVLLTPQLTQLSLWALLSLSYHFPKSHFYPKILAGFSEARGCEVTYECFYPHIACTLRQQLTWPSYPSLHSTRRLLKIMRFHHQDT